MHLAGRYLDSRVLFPPLLKQEIQIGLTIRISLEKKSGAVVSWVLNNLRCSKMNSPVEIPSAALVTPAAPISFRIRQLFLQILDYFSPLTQHPLQFLIPFYHLGAECDRFLETIILHDLFILGNKICC